MNVYHIFDPLILYLYLPFHVLLLFSFPFPLLIRFNPLVSYTLGVELEDRTSLSVEGPYFLGQVEGM